MDSLISKKLVGLVFIALVCGLTWIVNDGDSVSRSARAQDVTESAQSDTDDPSSCDDSEELPNLISGRLEPTMEPTEDGEYRLVDANGKFLSETAYKVPHGFAEGRSIVADDADRRGFIDENGRVAVIPQYEMVLRYSEGLAAVKQGGKWGYIDKRGNFRIKPRFYDALHFKHGIAAVVEREGAGFVFITTSGSRLFDAEFDLVYDVVNGFAGVKRGDKWGFIDMRGTTVLPFEFDEIKETSEGWTPVKRGKLWGFIEIVSGRKIENKFENVLSFQEGVAAASAHGKWGFIDTTGEWVIQPQFDNVSKFERGVATIEKSGDWQFIDVKGNLSEIK